MIQEPFFRYGEILTNIAEQQCYVKKMYFALNSILFSEINYHTKTKCFDFYSIIFSEMNYDPKVNQLKYPLHLFGHDEVTKMHNYQSQTPC